MWFRKSTFPFILWYIWNFVQNMTLFYNMKWRKSFLIPFQKLSLIFKFRNSKLKRKVSILNTENWPNSFRNLWDCVSETNCPIFKFLKKLRGHFISYSKISVQRWFSSKIFFDAQKPYEFDSYNLKMVQYFSIANLMLFKKNDFPFFYDILNIFQKTLIKKTSCLLNYICIFKHTTALIKKQYGSEDVWFSRLKHI